MRKGYFFWLCIIALPVQAEIYKCEINGQIEFSGQPCAEDAERIELKVRQPSVKAIAEQKARTESFQEESKFSDIDSLNRKNDALEAQITALEKERQTVLADMREKTYRVDNDTIGTREQGLFKRMQAVGSDYDRKLDRLRQQVYENDLKIEQLHEQ
jgi:hypothetical protein